MVCICLFLFISENFKYMNFEAEQELVSTEQGQHVNLEYELKYKTVFSKIEQIPEFLNNFI